MNTKNDLDGKEAVVQTNGPRNEMTQSRKTDNRFRLTIGIDAMNPFMGVSDGDYFRANGEIYRLSISPEYGLTLRKHDEITKCLTGFVNLPDYHTFVYNVNWAATNGLNSLNVAPGLTETKVQSSRPRCEATPMRVGPPSLLRDEIQRELNSSWQFITSAKAWSLSEKSGKAAPYAGYMIELKDGRKLRCRRDAHKTVFEISAASNLNTQATNTAEFNPEK